MKSLTLTFITILAIHCSTFGQWAEKNISTSATLTSVDFLNDDIGFVVGANKIFSTNNGGDSWETSFSASPLVFLEDIFIVNSNKILAAGKDFDTGQSKMYKTENGGNTWASIPIPNSVLLKSIYFPSDNIGYCSGGNTIFKTTNGGNTWQALDSWANNHLQSIFFVNDTVGFAVGGTVASSIILKTRDAGQSWLPMNAPSDNYLQSVFFVNQDTGYVIGWNGEILKTENCGSTWNIQNSVTMTGNLEVTFTDLNTGYIVGGQLNESFIQKTSNGGISWEDVSPPNMDGLKGVDFPSANIGYAVGANGSVVKTTSAGMLSATNDVASLDQIKIFPNPVHHHLHIQSTDYAPIRSLKIYDTSGRLMSESKPDANNIELDFSAWEPNIYYLKIRTDRGSMVKKIIKT